MQSYRDDRYLKTSLIVRYIVKVASEAVLFHFLDARTFFFIKNKKFIYKLTIEFNSDSYSWMFYEYRKP